MKVLMLPRYARMGASSRYRLMQYVPLLESAGNDVEVWPLLDDQYTRELYLHHRRPASVLFTGYQRRLRRMVELKGFDTVICEQEAFPYLPNFFEQLVQRRAQKFLLDYDDAAYIRYKRVPLLQKKIERLMASANSVVVGNGHLAVYAEQFNDRVTVIPSVVDLSRYPYEQRTTDSKIVRVVWIGTPVTAELLAPLPIYRCGKTGRDERASYRTAGLVRRVGNQSTCRR
jgi:hypothetical protein